MPVKFVQWLFFNGLPKCKVLQKPKGYENAILYLDINPLNHPHNRFSIPDIAFNNLFMQHK